MRCAVLAALAAALSSAAWAHDPDCSGPERWAASIAFVELRNAGIVNAEMLDGSKTTVRLLASQKVGKDLYRQVHLVTYVKKTGETVPSITVNEASNSECSETAVDVYPVSTRLGGYTEEKAEQEAKAKAKVRSQPKPRGH